MKAIVNWEEGMKFTGQADSGFALQMDADIATGGANTAIRPMEMVALGLIGCQAMDVISILLKKRQDVTMFEVRFDGPRSHEHPKVFTSAAITFVVTGRRVDEAALLRSIELTADKYCPASAMLEKAFPMQMHYEIYEDEGGGDKRLMVKGLWERITNNK